MRRGECEGRNGDDKLTDQVHEGEIKRNRVKTNKRARNERKSLVCLCTNRSDLSPPFFVSVFIPPPPSVHPSPNRVSYPLSLLSFCLPPPAPPRSHARSSSSSSSCSSLQYTVPGGDSSKSNCLSISHQYNASRGFCPLKTMKVGLSAEPWMGFNYINKQFSIKKGTLQTGRLQYFNAVHIIKTYYFNVAAEYRVFYLN